MHPWRLKNDLYAVLKNKPHDFAPGGVFLRKNFRLDLTHGGNFYRNCRQRIDNHFVSVNCVE